MKNDENVVDLDTGTPYTTSRGGKVGNKEDRVLERLTILEERVRHLASKEDIQKIKIWVLSGVIGAAVAAIPVAFIVVRLFSSS